MEEKIISVTGHGNIHVVPDVTRVELTLVSLHDTYQEAYEQTKSDTDKIARIMESVKLSKNLPKTIRLDIDKKTTNIYDKFNNFKEQKFLGFQLTHLVKIDLGMDNVLLNKVVKSIGDQLKQAEINIGYTLKDSRPSQLRVIERAVLDAKQKAEIMAKAAGCRLGMCKNIRYGEEDVHFFSQARYIHGAEEASCCNRESLEITPDDLVMSDTVDVEWCLGEIIEGHE